MEPKTGVSKRVTTRDKGKCIIRECVEEPARGLQKIMSKRKQDKMKDGNFNHLPERGYRTGRVNG